MQTRSRRKPRGFTLLELMAGLAIVGVLFAGMHSLLDQLGDAGQRFSHEARRSDGSANASRMLRDLVQEAQSGTDSVDRFSGDDRAASFVSWCHMPGGWLERCHVLLELTPHGDSTSMLGTISHMGSFTMWAGKGDAHFLYFTPSTPDDTWVSAWGRSITAPRAIGVATDSYLMVLGAGGRE